MKTRTGFVSNSSSCSFTITNNSEEEKTLLDFVKETEHLFNRFQDWYGYDEPTNWHQVIREAEANVVGDFPLAPGKERYMIFGDESGTIIGTVFDYMLRDGGRTENFSWRFVELMR